MHVDVIITSWPYQNVGLERNMTKTVRDLIPAANDISWGILLTAEATRAHVDFCKMNCTNVQYNGISIVEKGRFQALI